MKENMRPVLALLAVSLIMAASLFAILGFDVAHWPRRAQEKLFVIAFVTTVFAIAIHGPIRRSRSQ